MKKKTAGGSFVAHAVECMRAFRAVEARRLEDPHVMAKWAKGAYAAALGKPKRRTRPPQ